MGNRGGRVCRFVKWVGNNKNDLKSTFSGLHSVEISGFYCHSDFTSNQLWFVAIFECQKLPFWIKRSHEF